MACRKLEDYQMNMSGTYLLTNSVLYCLYLISANIISVYKKFPSRSYQKSVQLFFFCKNEHCLFRASIFQGLSSIIWICVIRWMSRNMRHSLVGNIPVAGSLLGTGTFLTRRVSWRFRGPPILGFLAAKFLRVRTWYQD